MKKLNYLFSLLCFMAISTWAFAQPANNECSGAIDLITSGPYDNTSATTEASDPTEGYDNCFGEPDGYGGTPSLENTLWFSFTGDGNLYFIEATSTGCSLTGTAIGENDTQMVIYSGGCGSLSPVICNEDGPNTVNGSYPAGLEFLAEDGVEYQMLIDGFNFNGSVSRGEFCVEFTQQASILCSNPNVAAGIVTVDQSVLCKPDSVALFTPNGSLSPNEGEVSGSYWVVSSDDLMGTLDPVSDPSALIAFYAPDGETPLSLNFGSSFGTYYMTQYVFGNATWTDPENIVETTFDNSCIYASNSVRLEFYPEDACPSVGVLDVDKAVLGMTVFPNPVKDVINLNINAQEQHSNAILMIANVTGKVVEQQQVDLLSGANALNINVSDMPTGVYMVSIESETHQSVTKFVKQ